MCALFVAHTQAVACGEYFSLHRVFSMGYYMFATLLSKLIPDSFAPRIEEIVYWETFVLTKIHGFRSHNTNFILTSARISNPITLFRIMRLISGPSTSRYSICTLCVYTQYCIYYLILLYLSLHFHIISYYIVRQSFHHFISAVGGWPKSNGP